MSEKILIDLSSIAHPIYHMSASDPNPDHASIQIVAKIRSLASNKPNVAICLDKGRSFRKDITATYKAQRPEQEAPLHHQIGLAIDILKKDGFPIWGVDGFEADDIIASATTSLLARNETDTVRIVSADKDLLQLVGPRVVAQSVRDGSTVDEAAVFAKFGVNPAQMRDFLTLVGDDSDNIKGAKGIGPKKAAELLKKYGSIDLMYATWKHQPSTFTPGLATTLREFEGNLAMTQSLVALRTDVALPVADIDKERMADDVAVFGDFEPSGTDEEFDDGLDEAMPNSPPPAAPAPPTTEAAPPTLDLAPKEAPATVLPPSAGAGGLPASPIKTEQGLQRRTAIAPSAVDEVLPAPYADYTMHLEPRSYRQAQIVADDLFKSKLFGAYGSAQAVLSTIVAGRELGMSAMHSLRGFHIVEGKPTLAADLMRALVLKSGAAKFFRCTERTATACTFETQRGDDPVVTLRYTIEEARVAFAKDEKAWNASGWGKNPADMLVARAGSKLARLVYPDIMHGLYAPEEFD